MAYGDAHITSLFLYLQFHCLYLLSLPFINATKKGFGVGKLRDNSIFYIKKMLFGYKETGGGAASILMLRAYVDHIK